MDTRNSLTATTGVLVGVFALLAAQGCASPWGRSPTYSTSEVDAYKAMAQQHTAQLAQQSVIATKPGSTTPTYATVLASSPPANLAHRHEPSAPGTSIADIAAPTDRNSPLVETRTSAASSGGHSACGGA